MGEAENATWALQAMGAYAGGDLEPMLDRVRPDVEWWPPVARVQGTPYVGHEGVRRWRADLDEAFEWIRTDDLEARTLPGVVLVRGVFRACARASGVEVSEPILHVFLFDDGAVRGYESILQPGDERLAEHGWDEARPYEPRPA